MGGGGRVNSTVKKKTEKKGTKKKVFVFLFLGFKKKETHRGHPLAKG